MSTWESNYLAHYGVAGQKWGLRRFQNEDGSLTEEGRRRYLANIDGYGVKAYSREAGQLYDQATARANQGLGALNKKWDKLRPQGFNGSDRESIKANLQYTKEVRDLYQQAYRDVLAKDMGTDPASLKGQKWLKGVLYYDAFDSEIRKMEKKLEKSDSKRDKSSAPVRKESASNTRSSAGASSKTESKPKKMSAEQAMTRAYNALEKQYPDFNKFSQDRQDQLLINYLNDSGLYKYF